MSKNLVTTKLNPYDLGAAFIVILFTVLIPFFIVSNTIRLIIHSKRHILSTLRLLGEKDFYIKLPFIFQGIWNGFLGALVSIFCFYVLDLIEFNVAIYDFINKTFGLMISIVWIQVCSSILWTNLCFYSLY